MKRLMVGWGVFFLTVGLALSTAFSVELLIDDFEKDGVNRLGARASTYVMAPSRVLAVSSKEGEGVDASRALMVKYDKKAEGGPYDSGGWCGFYSLLKSGSKYFDASGYQAVTFQVKGAAGGENFVIGVSDRHWDEVGDSVKSSPVVDYLPGGKLTTQWQKATIPLSAFPVDLREMASVAVCFEGSVFPDGAGKGTVYVDDLKLE